MRKVIVLDDNADILHVVTEVLAYEQFEVKGISASNELIPLAESFSPDLILLDMRLRDGNGGELCSQIKTHPVLKDTPVVIFTAYQRPTDDFSIYGCDAVINKPFDLDTLVDTIDKLAQANKAY